MEFLRMHALRYRLAGIVGGFLVFMLLSSCQIEKRDLEHLSDSGSDECVPKCEDKPCGESDGCGGVCQDCSTCECADGLLCIENGCIACYLEDDFDNPGDDLGIWQVADAVAGTPYSGHWEIAADGSLHLTRNTDGAYEKAILETILPAWVSNDVPFQLQAQLTLDTATSYCAVWLREHIEPGGDYSGLLFEADYRSPETNGKPVLVVKRTEAGYEFDEPSKDNIVLWREPGEPIARSFQLTLSFNGLYSDSTWTMAMNGIERRRVEPVSLPLTGIAGVQLIGDDKVHGSGCTIGQISLCLGAVSSDSPLPKHCTDGNLEDNDGCSPDGMITEFELASSKAGTTLRGPDIAAVSTGMVVVWLSDGNAGSQILLHHVGFDGPPLEEPAVVESMPAGKLHSPSVACDKSGGCLVVWGSRADGTLMGKYYWHPEYARQEDPKPFEIDAGDLGGADIAYLDNGNFVVAWTKVLGGGIDTGYYRVLGMTESMDGYSPDFLSEVANKTTAKKDTAGYRESDHSVAAIPGGGSFVIVWGDDEHEGDKSSSRVYARVFDSDGTPLSNEAFPVSDGKDDWQATPDVAGLSDDTFVVVWQSGSNPTVGRVFARLCFTSGICSKANDKEGFPLHSAEKMGSESPSVAVLPSLEVGSLPTEPVFVVAWQGEGWDSDLGGIAYKLLDGDGDSLMPTPLVANEREQSGEWSGKEEDKSSEFGHQVSPAAVFERLPEGSLALPGTFVVVWKGPALSGGGEGLYGKRFWKNGQAVFE